MASGDVVADDRVDVMLDVHNRAVLQVRPGPDDDAAAHIRSQHAAVPDRGIGADFDVSDDDGAWRYPCRFVDAGRLALERKDQGAALVMLR